MLGPLSAHPQARSCCRLARPTALLQPVAVPFPHISTHAPTPCHAVPPRHPLLLQLLAAAGMDKGALEEELAEREEQHLVAEFRRNLQYNMGKVGEGTAGGYCRVVGWAGRCLLGWGCALCLLLLRFTSRLPARLPAVGCGPGAQQPQGAPAPAAAGGVEPAGDAAGQGGGGGGAAAALRRGARRQPAGAVAR